MPDIIDDAQRHEAMFLAQALASRGRQQRGAEPQERDHMGRIICAECGELIPLARLASVPTATRCAQCQEEMEGLRERFDRA